MDSRIFDFFPEEDNSEETINEKLKELGYDIESLEKEFENYTPKKELFYQSLDLRVPEPLYNYPSDSGFDLYSTIDLELQPFERALVPTGLRFGIPDGTEIQIRPKSGLALKLGLTVLNTPGTVDSGYDGEIKVILFNTSNEVIKIERFTKIAQAVLCPVINGKWVELIKVDEIENKDRGSNGFGSTGLKF